MTFIQEYTIFEQGFGEQTIRFVVSDTYADLMSPDSDFTAEGDGLHVDIFQLGTVKKSLDGEGLSVGVDELSFTINEGACESEDDKKAFHFCRQASNINKHRFVALYFNPDFTSTTALLNSRLFLGKIESSISGDDLVIVGTEYTPSKYPKRELSFSAISFDIGMFDKITVKAGDRITKEDGTTIGSLFDRLTKADFVSLFPDRYHDWNNNAEDEFPYKYVQSVGTLYDGLTVILNKAAEILSELLSPQTFTITLEESPLGMSTASYYYNWEVVNYRTRRNVKNKISRITPAIPGVLGTATFNLFLCSETSAFNSYEKATPVYINWKLINPEYSKSERNLRDDSVLRAEKEDSFQQYSNLTDLLVGIAKSLGCFVVTTYNGMSGINIKFVSHEATPKTSIYVKDVAEGSIDSSSVINDGENLIYANTTPYSIDSQDFMPAEFTESDNMSARKEQLRNDKDDGINAVRILFSSGITFVRKYTLYDTPIIELPLNVIMKPSLGSSEYYEYNDLGVEAHSIKLESEREHLMTNLYIKQLIMGDYAIRPMTRCMVDIDGVGKVFNSLAEYINALESKSLQYYETEYNLTVPFWNGFSESSNGSFSKWNKLDLGSKIPIIDRVKEFEGTWAEGDATTYYVVREIEINLAQPETKIKMTNQSRFNFGFWDEGKTGNEQYSNENILSPSVQESPYDEYVAGEVITEGDVVQVASDGRMMIALPDSIKYGTTIGVAKNDAAGGELVWVQVDGIVVNLELELDIGKAVFWDGTYVQDVVGFASGGDDMIIYLGIAETESSFLLNIREVVIE